MIIKTNSVIGKIKELHGVDCAPYSRNLEGNQVNVYKMFKYGGFPRSRLHDCCGAYGGTYYVDIPNIFRDFDADENLEESYDFHYTDEYIGAIIKSGAQIVYRLGVTIEWGSKKYTCHPPKDFAKWARICEHIIMHYNKGWANGFHYDIEYWEIWNEPENPPMWTGTMEQFFDLYEVSSKYLKEKFPEIKIGGYGSCGFYAAFMPDVGAFHESFLTWFDEFLKFVKKNNCPLDFYSWHIYTDKVSEVEASDKYVKEKLDEYGFENVESHLNEWNYGGEGGGFDQMDTLYGASFAAAALICMQKGHVDLAQYYCVSAQGSYNGMYENLRTKAYSPVIHVFAMFKHLFNAKDEVLVEKSDNEPAVIAASDGKDIYALISNYQADDKMIDIKIDGLNGKTAYLYELVSGKGCVKTVLGSVLECKKDSVYFITTSDECDVAVCE